MHGPNGGFAEPRSWIRALLLGVGASSIYAAVLIGYTLLPSSNVSLTAPAWQAFGVTLLGVLGAVGVPIALWSRFQLRSPLVLMGLVLVFWHVLVEVPIIGSGQGDSPGFIFVFLFAPFYVVAYLLLAGGEHWLRGQEHLSLPINP